MKVNPFKETIEELKSNVDRAGQAGSTVEQQKGIQVSLKALSELFDRSEKELASQYKEWKDQDAISDCTKLIEQAKILLHKGSKSDSFGRILSKIYRSAIDVLRPKVQESVGDESIQKIQTHLKKASDEISRDPRVETVCNLLGLNKTDANSLQGLLNYSLIGNWKESGELLKSLKSSPLRQVCAQRMAVLYLRENNELEAKKILQDGGFKAEEELQFLKMRMVPKRSSPNWDFLAEEGKVGKHTLEKNQDEMLRLGDAYMAISQVIFVAENNLLENSRNP